MGFCCGASKVRINADKVAHDLPLKKYTDAQRAEIGETLVAFYERLPFAYTHLNYYAKQLRSLSKDAFEVDELKDLFPNNTEWQKEEHWADDSEMKTLFLALPNTEGTAIQLQTALCLGLLLCQADDYNKAECLFELFQDPDSQSQDMVSASDRDIKPTIRAIANIASGCILEGALKDDEEQLEAKMIEVERRQKVIDAMLYSEIGDEKKNAKLGFITLTFGYDSLLQRKDFVSTIMSKKSKWILNDHALRQRMVVFDDDTVLEECE